MFESGYLYTLHTFKLVILKNVVEKAATIIMMLIIVTINFAQALQRKNIIPIVSDSLTVHVL